MRKMFAVGLAAIMAMGLCTCGSQKAPETTAAPAVAATTTTAASGEEKEEATEAQVSSGTADGEGYVVTLHSYSIGNSWRIQMEQGFVAEAEGLKIEDVVSEYYITNSNENINKQISDVRDLIIKKVDAIVIMAASPTALVPVVKEAVEAGIKMVSFDNVIETDEQVATVGIDEKEFGRIGTERLVDRLDGRDRIVVLNGIVRTATSSLHWDGAEEVFKQYPDIEILGSASASQDYAQGKATMESMLSAYPEIDGVWSQGGAMTQGTIDAFIATGRDLVSVTSGGNSGAIRAWIENKDKGLSCITPSNPTYASVEALRVVIKALNSEDIPGNVVMGIETVTEENVDRYYHPGMSDGFQVLTELDDAAFQRLYKQSAHFRDDGQAGEYRPVLHIKAMSVPEREGG